MGYNNLQGQHLKRREVIGSRDLGKLACFRLRGDGDIDTTSRCASEITHFCAEIKPGEGRIIKCLNNQKEQEDKGNVDGRKLTEDCKDEMRNVKIEQ
eukprot:2201876-Pyramimonas_sp.AAC.1